MRQGRGEATGTEVQRITQPNSASYLLYLLIPPVIQKRRTATPPPLHCAWKGDLGLRDVKHFVPGSQRSGKQNHFLCATGTVLSFPKGSGSSWLEKVQSCGQEALATQVARAGHTPAPLRACHGPAEKQGSGRGALATRWVLARRMWVLSGLVGGQRAASRLPGPRGSRQPQAAPPAGWGASRACRGAGRLSLNLIREPCPGKESGGVHRPGGEGASGARGARRAALSTSLPAGSPSPPAPPRSAPPLPSVHLLGLQPARSSRS